MRFRIPANFQGYNAALVGFDNFKEAPPAILADTLEYIGAKRLRLPGGDIANFMNWDEGRIIGDAKADEHGDGRRYGKYSDFDRTPEPLPFHLRWQTHKEFKLEDVASVVKNGRFELTWCVNILTGGGGGETALAKEVRHLKEAEALGMSVDNIELGNELYFTIPNYRWSIADGEGAIENSAGYARRAARWAQRMRQEFPDAKIYAIGSDGHHYQDQDWNEQLVNHGVFDYVDGVTIHPYHSINEASNAQLSDVGNAQRAEEIAIASLNQLKDTLNNPKLDLIPDDKRILITEHAVIEDSNNPKTGRVVWGNTWASSLCLTLHNLTFLVDGRIEGADLHVLTGNPQWEAIANERGEGIDPAKRGKENAPYSEGVYEPLEPTMHGFTLGLSADILNGGEGTLLASEPGYMAIMVERDGSTFLLAVNTTNKERSLTVPDGFNGVVSFYVAGPWYDKPTLLDEDEILYFKAGEEIDIPAWSKVIGEGAAVENDPPVDVTPPTVEPAPNTPSDMSEKLRELNRRLTALEDVVKAVKDAIS